MISHFWHFSHEELFWFQSRKNRSQLCGTQGKYTSKQENFSLDLSRHEAWAPPSENRILLLSGSKTKWVPGGKSIVHQPEPEPKMPIWRNTSLLHPKVWHWMQVSRGLTWSIRHRGVALSTKATLSSSLVSWLQFPRFQLFGSFCAQVATSQAPRDFTGM